MTVQVVRQNTRQKLTKTKLKGISRQGGLSAPQMAHLAEAVSFGTHSDSDSDILDQLELDVIR